MSETTTSIATFNPANRFVTFEGLKDYDANLIFNLHRLGYNNKVSGANIFAWGNNNQIDGQNLFVFGNKFLYSGAQTHPSLFIGTFGGDDDDRYRYFDDTLFGVWGGGIQPVFKVSNDSTAEITGSSDNYGKFVVYPHGFSTRGFHFSRSSGMTIYGQTGGKLIDFQFNSEGVPDRNVLEFDPSIIMNYARRTVQPLEENSFALASYQGATWTLTQDSTTWGWDDKHNCTFPPGLVIIQLYYRNQEQWSSMWCLSSYGTFCLAAPSDSNISVSETVSGYKWTISLPQLGADTENVYMTVTPVLSVA